MKKRFLAIFIVVMMLFSQITVFASVPDSSMTHNSFSNEEVETINLNNDFCCDSFSDSTKESFHLGDNGDSLNTNITNTVVFELKTEQNVVELNNESEGLTVLSCNYENEYVYVTFTYNEAVIAPKLTVAVLLEDNTVLTANMYGYYFEEQLFISGASRDDAFEKYCLFLLNSEAINEIQYKTIRNSYYSQSVTITTNTEPAMQTMVAPGVAETQASSKITFLRGILVWNDDRGFEHPCQYIKVNVYDKDDESSELITSTYTNEGGFFSVSFENGSNLLGQNGYDIYIEVFTEGETVSVKNTNNITYSISTESAVIENVEDGSTNDISIKFEMKDDGYFVGGDLARAMQVSQPAIIASKYASEMRGTTMPHINVIYPVDDDRCWYSRDTVSINISSGNNFNHANVPRVYASWDVIMHEYGHFVQHMVGNISENPGGTHFINTNMADHYYDEILEGELCETCQNNNQTLPTENYCRHKALKISWAEAWATVFGFMAQQYYIDSLQNIDFIGDAEYNAYNIRETSTHDLETLVNSFPGESNETTVISILYNLYDANINSFDNISLSHQVFWSATVNSQPTILSDFIKYLLNNNIVAEDAMADLLDYYQINSKTDSIQNCSASTLPTFYWEARGGSNYFENNAFNIVFYDKYGFEILETARITGTSYTVTENEWQLILSNCGDQFKWAVIAYQTDNIETGPYRSVKSNIVTVPTTLVNLDIGIQGNIEEEYGYDWYKFTAPTSGIYSFYTTGTTDTYADIFNGMVYQRSTTNRLDYDDDSGDSTNFKITYSLSANRTIYIRVRAFSTRTGSYTLFAHLDEHVHNYVVGSWIPSTETAHKRYCDCGEYTEEAHNFVTNGTTGYVCTICRYTTTGSVVMPTGINDFDILLNTEYTLSKKE